MIYILKSPRRQMGYLIVDHSNSPGLTKEQARWAGYGPEAAGECKVYETHTLTCCECKTVVIPNPLRIRERATCPYHNNHYCCDVCKFRMSQPGYVHSPVQRATQR